jgi:hypothetical protein
MAPLTVTVGTGLKLIRGIHRNFFLRPSSYATPQERNWSWRALHLRLLAS